MEKPRALHYYLWTIGCQMNAADSRRLSAQLERLGYQPTETPSGADVVVLNTCVVRQQAEDKIYGRLGSLSTVKKENPGVTIAVMGCLVGRHEAPALQARFPFVDVFMAPSDGQPLLDFLLAHGRVAPDWVGDATAGATGEAAANDERAWRDALQDAESLLPRAERGRATGDPEDSQPPDAACR